MFLYLFCLVLDLVLLNVSVVDIVFCVVSACLLMYAHAPNYIIICNSYICKCAQSKHMIICSQQVPLVNNGSIQIKTSQRQQHQIMRDPNPKTITKAAHTQMSPRLPRNDSSPRLRSLSSIRTIATCIIGSPPCPFNLRHPNAIVNLRNLDHCQSSATNAAHCA